MKKSVLLLDSGSCGGGPVVPSPTPPWANPPVSPLVQTCFGNDTAILNVDTTYLTQATPPVVAAGQPAEYIIVIPNGNYARQYHTFIVPGNISPTSATFKVTGAFNGFKSLLFNQAATSAQLVWDGYAWNLMGGNAQQSNS